MPTLSIRSERSEEIDEVFLLLVGEFHIKPPIIKIDNLAQRFCRTVREIWSTRGESAKLLHDDRTDIHASARNERAARVRRVDDPAQIGMRIGVLRACDLEDRKLARLSPCRRLGPGGEIVCADIHPSGRQVLA